MLGAVIGDIVGSVYENNNIKMTNFPLFSLESRITDDSVCTIAVAESIVTGKSVEECLKAWGQKYREVKYPAPFYPDFFSRGFLKWLDNDSDFKGDANSNGAVMRIAPVAFLIKDTLKAYEFADHITKLTHNHPDSIRAVHAYIDTLHMIFNKCAVQDIRNHLKSTYQYNMDRSVSEIRPHYKNYHSCNRTVPESIICALEADSFEQAIRFAVSLGGDSDTLACMTGAVAEARFGIPDHIRRQAEKYIPHDMKIILQKMYNCSLMNNQNIGTKIITKVNRKPEGLTRQ